MASDSTQTVIDVIGWIYFAAWSISFYPQVILNYQRKSVKGLSLEFQLYNVTGFTFYSIYTITNYYYQHELGLTYSVELQDIAFAVHALILTIITVYQCWIYGWRIKKVNKIHMMIWYSLWLLCIYNIIMGAIGAIPWHTQDNGDNEFNVIEFLGYAKSVISLVKYIPQAYINCILRHTVGWSIWGVLLDFTGGAGSFLQQFLKAKYDDDWTVFTGNIPKLLLSIESISFDILFLIQNYILFRHNNAYQRAKEKRRRAKLADKQQAIAEGHSSVDAEDEEDEEDSEDEDRDNSGRVQGGKKKIVGENGEGEPADNAQWKAPAERQDSRTPLNPANHAVHVRYDEGAQEPAQRREFGAAEVSSVSSSSGRGQRGNSGYSSQH